MDKEERKVSIKLERHRWPDEIAKEKRKKRIIITVVASIVASFMIGWQSNNFIKRSNVNPGNSELNRFDLVYQDLIDYWYFIDKYDNPEKELVDNAIKGMLEINGDPHTSYMTETESNDLASSIDRDFEGIGVQYYAGDLNVVTRVFKNSPAEKAGVKAGDILHQVDGVKIEGKTSEEIQSLIMGESGTNVNVEFLRNQEIVKFDIKRGKINALVWGEVIEEGLGYVEISSFGSHLGDSLKAYLDEMIEQDVHKLIIDLRDNGGGYLHAIQEIAPIFFDNNDVVYQENYKNKDNKVYNVSRSEKSKYQFDDIVILMNENSASASEVLAIAMREVLDSKIVGVKSYGKGTIQMQKKYPDSSALKITMAKWLSPHGENINEVGIKPDVEVKLADIFYADYVDLKDSVVKYDTVHDAVSYVQKALKYLGYHEGRTDGYYDAATKNALEAYQRKMGLEINSDLDQESVKQIYSSVVADWSQNKDKKDVQLHKAIEVVKNGS